MSGIRDQNVHRAAQTPKKYLNVAVVSAISLTGAVIYSFTPGYKFRLHGTVASFCRTKAGTVTAVVKIGTRTAATIAFTQATEVANALSTTFANIIGSATEAITIELTTDGSGVLANAFIVLGIRPWPLNSENGSQVI